MRGNLSIQEEELLRDCREIEYGMEKLYDLLADQHVQNHRISDLWKKTAHEEASHAAAFTLSQRASSYAMVQEVVTDRTEVDKALEMVRETIEAYKGKPPGIREALQKAVRLEEVLFNFHIEFAVAFTAEQHRKLFHALAAADRDHIGSLKRALDNYKAAPEHP